ncbi:unnamed protein product [Lactuca virosa]|uniref:Uncharacterized protein n=1 Tax=Lactuca virosa TaxID=75947 RepID=A0AAU9MSP6_9ASTR|nr:unnamed protein product [Lactuca virosa]
MVLEGEVCDKGRRRGNGASGEGEGDERHVGWYGLGLKAYSLCVRAKGLGIMVCHSRLRAYNLYLMVVWLMNYGLWIIVDGLGDMSTEANTKPTRKVVESKTATINPDIPTVSPNKPLHQPIKCSLSYPYKRNIVARVLFHIWSKYLVQTESKVPEIISHQEHQHQNSKKRKSTYISSDALLKKTKINWLCSHAKLKTIEERTDADAGSEPSPAISKQRSVYHVE